jgi:hypothetical protein
VYWQTPLKDCFYLSFQPCKSPGKFKAFFIERERENYGGYLSGATVKMAVGSWQLAVDY